MPLANEVDDKSKEAVRECEHRYMQIMHGLPVPVYTCDKNGYISLFNEAAVTLWGQRPIGGKDVWCGSWKTLDVNNIEVDRSMCPTAVTLKTGKSIFGREVIFERPDTSRRNVLSYPNPIFDISGNLQGAVTTLIDITDQVAKDQVIEDNKKTMQLLNMSVEERVLERTIDLHKKNVELRSSEERYHKMVEEVQDYAILLMDIHGVIQNWNQGAQKIKGYAANEIIGKNFRVFYTEKDRTNKVPESLLTKAIETGRAAQEGWRLRKDGTLFWASVVITALHDDRSNIVGFSKLTRDLTERKTAEDKLRENANELKAQNEELQQFAYIASHDMKEPLRKIAISSDILRGKIKEKLDPSEKVYLERIENAAIRMQALIDDLLSYTKTSLHDDAFEQVDLNEVVSSVISFYAEKIVEAGIIVHCEKLPVIHAVPFQMKQLFDNLIGNAIKYRHTDHKLEINITYESVTHVQVNSANETGHFYKISVSDNGIGFNEQYSAKIFDLFQRLVTKDKYSGTGIGLAICKKIAQNHKGHIQANGRENEGARFDVYFPKDNESHAL